MKVDLFVHFFVPTYLEYILFYMYYILKKKKVFVVLFYINLDDGFVTWPIPNKACGAISYDVTFFTLKSV